jgi:hypothetical protein
MPHFKPSVPASKIWIDLILLGISIAFFIPFIYFIKPIRVGDGSQYYALELAWKTTLRPYMTDTSWMAYDHLTHSGQIAALVSTTDLKNTYPTLTIGSTGDFLHFWFYSLCAAVVAGMGSIFGADIPSNASFLILHCILLASLLVIARRNFGWKGLAAVSILTFFSPSIWYVNKVHTEFFTYCVTTSAVILFLRKRYVAAAFFLALASTQNISFAAISFFTLGIDLWSRKKLNYSGIEMVLLALTIILVFIHPAYYLLRYGTVDPQFYTAGAKIGSNLRYAWIWLIDPDLGLFPNWPLGIVLLILALIALRGRSLNRPDLFYWLIFAACYITVSLIAQSSTTIMNSGATPGMARYAIWYLGLFFPALLLIVDHLSWSKWFSVVFIVLLLPGAAVNLASFFPTLPVRYTTPSILSLWLQKNTPNLYNPPPEVFAKRFSGIGENPSLWNALAIVGPDCHKILLINPSLKDVENGILGGRDCGFDPGKLSQIIKEHLTNGSWAGTGAPTYVRLTDAEWEESQFIPVLGNWYGVNQGSVITSLMLNGWSTPGQEGTWSDGGHATLALPYLSKESHLSIEIETSPFTAPAHPYTLLTIYIGGNRTWSGNLSRQTIIRIRLPDNLYISDSKPSLEFVIANPASPLSLGISTDQRALGIQLTRIRFISSNP